MAGALAKRSSDGTVARRRSSGAAPLCTFCSGNCVCFGAAGARGKAGSSYFYTDASSVLRLSPQAVIVAAIGFIMFVFILHIFGKLRS